MTFTQIPQRLEIAFWATVIPMMKDSTLVGDMIAWVYAWVEDIREMKVWQQLVLMAVTGLLVGFAIGLFRAGSW